MRNDSQLRQKGMEMSVSMGAEAGKEAVLREEQKRIRAKARAIYDLLHDKVDEKENEPTAVVTSKIVQMIGYETVTYHILCEVHETLLRLE